MPPPGGFVGVYRCAASGDIRDASHRACSGDSKLRGIRQTAIGVGDASVALAPGHLDRLDLGVEASDRRVHRPVKRRQDVERHERRDALRVRRDRGDLDAVVGRGDRLDPVAAVRGDVVGGHHAACRLDGPGDLLADRPAVVGVPPAVGEGAKRRRKQWLAEGRRPGRPRTRRRRAPRRRTSAGRWRSPGR